MGNVNSIPIEIWFDICEFVKLYEAPNLFLVNCNSFTICEEFFFSGNVEKRRRNVRDLSMIQSAEGTLEIKILRDEFVPIPVPEIDPPNVFNSFGKITVGKCCHKQALQFLLKFQALISAENVIACERQFFSNMEIIDEKENFLNWMEQKERILVLNFSKKCTQIARILAKPVLAKFNGSLCMRFKNGKNLCEPEGQQKDAKLIYEWLSAGNGKFRQFNINHYDGKKALELACQIARHFEMAHSDKKMAEKMDIFIYFPLDTKKEVAKYKQKIYNSYGDHLATLCSTTLEDKTGAMIPAYLFFTKPLVEDLFPIDKVFKMQTMKCIHFK